MPLISTSEEQRMRLSRGSFEVHTLHEQPICGTPEDVPVPKKVILHLFRGIECSSITKAFKINNLKSHTNCTSGRNSI